MSDTIHDWSSMIDLIAESGHIPRDNIGLVAAALLLVTTLSEIDITLGDGQVTSSQRLKRAKPGVSPPSA